MGNKRFFSSHAKSSAMVVSLIIHAVVILAAILVVVAKVIIPDDPEFKVKKIKRPKMPPKKIQVPVEVKKRKPKPRLRKRIVVNTKTFTDFQMPEVTGVKGGLGNMGGDGLGGIGFDIEFSLLGSNKSMGNELTGTFYDLKQTKDGEPSKIGLLHAKKASGRDSQALFYEELARFAKGWNSARLNDFFQAPRKKYASFFMVPTISSSRVTKAFGVEDQVKAVYWAAYYEGHISPPETGRFRFYGNGDDILLVRINKRLVLDASFRPYQPALKTNWKSDDENDGKYPIGKGRRPLYIGDWFKMTKGKPLKMEVLIGDVGNISSFRLLIEQKGVEYKQVPYTFKGRGMDIAESGTRPILPVFKTKEIPDDPKLIKEMKIKSDQASLDGPIFGAKQ